MDFSSLLCYVGVVRNWREQACYWLMKRPFSKESYTWTIEKLPFIGFTYFSFLLRFRQKWKVKNIYLFMRRTKIFLKGTMMNNNLGEVWKSKGAYEQPLLSALEKFLNLSLEERKWKSFCKKYGKSLICWSRLRNLFSITIDWIYKHKQDSFRNFKFWI